MTKTWWEIQMRNPGGQATQSTGRPTYEEAVEYARACKKQGMVVSITKHNVRQWVIPNYEWEEPR